MKKLVKIIRICLFVAAGLSLVVLMGFVGSSMKDQECRKVQIEVEDDGNYFVDEADVMDMLSSKGSRLQGSRMEDINTGMLEKIINTNPFIQNAEVFSTIDGNLNVTVKQRTPVLRIMNAKEEDFYIDENGVFMPVSDKYTAPVMIANGYIFNSYAERKVKISGYNPSDTVTNRQMLEQLYTLTSILRKDAFWNAQIEQLYVNEWQEIEMIPRVGNHKIIIGDVSHAEEKLGRLLTFYKKGLNKIGWNTYHTINLKFKNQVVCSKN